MQQLVFPRQLRVPQQVALGAWSAPNKVPPRTQVEPDDNQRPTQA
jgi:hypothetical protein